MKLSEVFNRNDQLKAAFTKALDFTIEKYAEYFDGDKADKARAALVGKFDVNRTKLEITTILQGLGVGPEGTHTAREIAQTILTQTNRFDK